MYLLLIKLRIVIYQNSGGTAWLFFVIVTVILFFTISSRSVSKILPNYLIIQLIWLFSVFFYLTQQYLNQEETLSCLSQFFPPLWYFHLNVKFDIRNLHVKSSAMIFKLSRRVHVVQEKKISSEITLSRYAFFFQLLCENFQ